MHVCVERRRSVCSSIEYMAYLQDNRPAAGKRLCVQHAMLILPRIPYSIVSLACSYCTVLPRHRDHRLQCFIMHHASSCSSPFSFSFRLVSSTTIHSQFTTQHHTKYRRIAAIVGSVGVAVYGVLVAEYSFPGKEEEDHVFSHVQASFRGALDQYVYGIVPGSTSRTRNTTDTDRTVQAQQQQSTGNTKQPGDR
jgi:hypothetical protein